MKIVYKIEKEDNNKSINQIMKENLNISTRLKTKLINNNCVYCNNKCADTRNFVKTGDVIDIFLDMKENNSNIVPTKMDLDIIYEDNAYLVLNKPAGISTHPSLRHYDNSLSNGVRNYFDKIGLKKKIRPVNRLDIDTSGLILFAKNEYVQECLVRQMIKNKFTKEYKCIVSGNLEKKKGFISLPIARKENSIIERCVKTDGQTAITHYKVLKEYPKYSLVLCKLETGRTHQIRVHMAYIGHPILGDTLYGKPSNLINRQALHCSFLSFIHPLTHKLVTYKSELPNDMKKLI